MKEYKCPNCGAPLTPPPQGPITCSYCRSVFSGMHYANTGEMVKIIYDGQPEYIVSCGGGGGGGGGYGPILSGGGGGGSGRHYSEGFVQEVIRLAQQGKQVRL